MRKDGTGEAAYDAIIRQVFQTHYRKQQDSFAFSRNDIVLAAEGLGIPRPKNIGDVIYAYRFRKDFPSEILGTETRDRVWQIRLSGTGQYLFVLVPVKWIEPSKARQIVPIPDATPEIVATDAKSDEQALLAIIRYNRLVDTFLGITAYSLQSHLRTSVKGVGQIEIDELYVGVDTNGEKYVVPVQAKGGRDRLGVAQIEQDLEFAAADYATLKCRAVAAQFVGDRDVALMEVSRVSGEVRVKDERHYRLVREPRPS